MHADWIDEGTMCDSFENVLLDLWKTMTIQVSILKNIINYVKRSVLGHTRSKFTFPVAGITWIGCIGSEITISKY